MYNLFEDHPEEKNTPEELHSEAGRSEGTGSWDSSEEETSKPQEEQIDKLNADVTLAEPGLVDQSELPEDYEEPEELNGEENSVDQTPGEETSPVQITRRVLSFEDYFKS